MEQPIHTLIPGQAFSLTFFTTGRTRHGTLVALWSGSALVEWEPETRRAMVRDRQSGELREIVFTRAKRENVALSTPVEAQ